MKRVAVTLFLALMLSPFAFAQQADVGFGVGTLLAPGPASAAGSFSPQTMGGGAFLSFSGDVLLLHSFGVEGEVAWRASQNTYYGIQPFRPILYDVNALYAPRFGKYVQVELLAGLGASSTRFYTPFYTCSYYTCTNYFSSNHFMGDVGAGVRVYVYHSVFVRPEFRQYFIHNNFEFSSAYATRVGVTLGYSFGH